MVAAARRRVQKLGSSGHLGGPGSNGHLTGTSGRHTLHRGSTTLGFASTDDLLGGANTTAGEGPRESLRKVEDQVAMIEQGEQLNNSKVDEMISCHGPLGKRKTEKDSRVPSFWRGFTKRYFVLIQDKLYYFELDDEGNEEIEAALFVARMEFRGKQRKTNTSPILKGVVSLSENSFLKTDFGSTLLFSTSLIFGIVDTKCNQNVYFQASNSESMETWKAALEKAIGKLKISNSSEERMARLSVPAPDNSQGETTTTTNVNNDLHADADDEREETVSPAKRTISFRRDEMMSNNSNQINNVDTTNMAEKSDDVNKEKDRCWDDDKNRISTMSTQGSPGSNNNCSLYTSTSSGTILQSPSDKMNSPGLSSSMGGSPLVPGPGEQSNLNKNHDLEIVDSNNRVSFPSVPKVVQAALDKVFDKCSDKKTSEEDAALLYASEMLAKEVEEDDKKIITSSPDHLLSEDMKDLKQNLNPDHEDIKNILSRASSNGQEVEEKLKQQVALDKEEAAALHKSLIQMENIDDKPRGVALFRQAATRVIEQNTLKNNWNNLLKRLNWCTQLNLPGGEYGVPLSARNFNSRVASEARRVV